MISGYSISGLIIGVIVFGFGSSEYVNRVLEFSIVPMMLTTIIAYIIYDTIVAICSSKFIELSYINTVKNAIEFSIVYYLTLYLMVYIGS